MPRTRLVPILVAILLAVVAQHGAAQESPSSSSGAAQSPAVNLRVQLVIARFAGEKKLSSLPNTFLVTTGSPTSAQVRMGVDAPISQKVAPFVTYQKIGTNIDCRATDLSDGRYRLNIQIEDTSIPTGASGNTDGLPPIIRHVSAAFDPVLRDGQSIQASVSTDPITGEVVKIDVTLAVLR